MILMEVWIDGSIRPPENFRSFWELQNSAENFLDICLLSAHQEHVA